MSNVKYCSECGNKVEFNYSPPKFCSNCGTPFGAVSKKANAAAPIRKQTRKSREVEEGFTDSDNVPDVSKLDLEIEFDNNVISLNASEDKGLHFTRSKFEKRNLNL